MWHYPTTRPYEVKRGRALPCNRTLPLWMLLLLALSLHTREVCDCTAKEEVMQSVNKTIIFLDIFWTLVTRAFPPDWSLEEGLSRSNPTAMNEALDAMKFLAALLIDPRNSRVYGVRDIIIVSSLHLQHRRWYRTPDKKLDIRQPFIRKVISLHIVLQRVLASSINSELWLY